MVALQQLNVMVPALQELVESAKAQVELVARGLSQDVVDSAREMLDAIGVIVDAPVPVIDEAAIAAAEDAMWAWYLEWSAIARLAIKDGRLLRSLGYRSGRASSEPDDETVDAPSDDDAIVAPVPMA